MVVSRDSVWAPSRGPYNKIMDDRKSTVLTFHLYNAPI